MLILACPGGGCHGLRAEKPPKWGWAEKSFGAGKNSAPRLRLRARGVPLGTPSRTNNRQSGLARPRFYGYDRGSIHCLAAGRSLHMRRLALQIGMVMAVVGIVACS